jgi:hypothetical protein
VRTPVSREERDPTRVGWVAHATGAVAPSSGQTGPVFPDNRVQSAAQIREHDTAISTLQNDLFLRMLTRYLDVDQEPQVTRFVDPVADALLDTAGPLLRSASA